MPQVPIPNGHQIAPATATTCGGFLFMDTGNPNTRADPQGLLANCSLGSLFSATDTGTLYVKTSATAWTAK